MSSICSRPAGHSSPLNWGKVTNMVARSEVSIRSHSMKPQLGHEQLLHQDRQRKGVPVVDMEAHGDVLVLQTTMNLMQVEELLNS